MTIDVAIVGGGLAGFATALRLQSAGLQTAVYEAHSVPGGCAGFWKTRGFSFDVGATTFVDFAPGGVGGRFLADCGVDAQGEQLEGYRVHLPDRSLTLWRDPVRWHAERLRALGDSPAHRRFWALIDHINAVFWPITRAGRVRMPMAGARDILANLRAVPPRSWAEARYLRWTMGDALRHCGLRDDRALVTTLGMLLEDTVHSHVDDAPLINGAMGIHIRGAGLTRFFGGARGLWKAMIRRYRELGGVLNTRCAVQQITRASGRYRVHSAKETVEADQVVCALPIAVTARIAPAAAGPLASWVRRDTPQRGGAILATLGVPEDEVADEALTHHGLFQDYAAPFGNGNNMFISVSSPRDRMSAPYGHRAVMISTHCELADWAGLDDDAYAARKAAITEQLLGYARRIYPRLGRAPVVQTVATPRSYARFTGRPDGAVGGVRQRLDNTNQHAVPHDIGVAGLHLVGDTTWPGLGTVSCLVGARAVSRQVMASH